MGDAAPRAFARRNVLVVDDEVDICDLLRYALTNDGFDVTVAGTGSEAVLAAQRRRPHVIVLDLTLPDADGFALLPRLRSVARCPVIILTARSRASDRARAQTLGAEAYVTKPFDVDDLLRRVRGATASA